MTKRQGLSARAAAVQAAMNASAATPDTADVEPAKPAPRPTAAPMPAPADDRRVSLSLRLDGARYGRLQDLAYERTKESGRRVPVHDILIEAIDGYFERLDR